MLQGVVALGVATGAVRRRLHHAAARGERDPARHRHGPRVMIMVGVTDLGRDGADGDRRRAGGLLRGADERPAAAPRPHPDGRRAPIAVQNFNENLSILMMTGLYALLIRARPVDQHRDRAVRALCRRHHAAGEAPPRGQPARVRQRGAARGSPALRPGGFRPGPPGALPRLHPVSAISRAREAEVFPCLGLVLRIAQQIGRMVGDHDRVPARSKRLPRAVRLRSRDRGRAWAADGRARPAAAAARARSGDRDTAGRRRSRRVLECGCVAVGT